MDELNGNFGLDMEELAQLVEDRPLSNTEKLRDLIAASNNIVFFGGAGVSTESNIPDFRSDNGIYKEKKYPHSAERMLSASYFEEYPENFYDFYLNELVYEKAEPNAAHRALAALEKAGKLRAVITQNVDGLHQKAGSKIVVELHGSVYRNYCPECWARYELDYMLKWRGSGGIPTCSKCGGVVRPDVVLYEEPLNADNWDRATQLIREADLFIVGGTSLVVYPAAALVRAYHGKKMVLINMSSTPFDHYADLVIHKPIGATFSRIMEDLGYGC